MAVLGLILLAAAGVLTAAVVTSNTDSLAVSLWSVDVSNVTLGVVFVAGMITTVLAVVGLGLLMGGMRRNRRLRRERRSLQRENEQLAQRVDSTPDSATSAGPSMRREEDTVVDRPNGSHGTDSDDRTRVQPPVAVGSGYESGNDEAATTPRRRFSVPRREERTTETVTRDV